MRPFATGLPVLRGLRGHFVYYNDHYAASDERKRVMGNVTFEHQYVNAGFDYMSAKDQTLATATNAESNGYSVWATPRKPMANNASFEALLRYDHWTPNTSTSIFAPPATSPQAGVTVLGDQHQNRTIVGFAYWFPHQGTVTAAIMLDYDGQSFKNITTPVTKLVTLHGLLTF